MFGFDRVLVEADAVNRQRRFDRDTGHLPGTMEKAVRFHRRQIKDHDAAMRAADIEGALAIRRQAHLMAVRVNHGDPGILAGPDAPGYVLQTRCAAPAGTIPLWGQQGRFTLNLHGVPILIALDGMFGLGGRYGPYLGFSARAVDYERPFISDTGFRSFLGGWLPVEPGITPEGFFTAVIAAHVSGAMKGKLRVIGLRYRPTPPTEPT